MPTVAKFNFDEKFQEKIVQTLYQDPDYASVVTSILKPTFFDSKQHRWVAKTILLCQEVTGSNATQTILLNEAQKAVVSGVIKDVEIPKYARLIARLGKPVADKTYIKTETFNFCRAQGIKDVILRAVDDWLPRGEYDAIQSGILDITQLDLANTNDPGMDLAKSFKKRQLRREKRLYNGITTGTKLDAYLEPGGIPPKAAAIAIAPTGRGKTNWLVHCAVTAALDADAPGPYVSLELDADMLGDRFDARLVGMPIRLLKKHQRDVFRRWEKLKTQLEGKLLIKDFSGTNITVNTLMQYLRSLERKAYYPKWMVVDHIDLLQPTVVTGDPYEDQGRAMWEFRELCKARKLAGWTASQGNRESMDEDPKKNPTGTVGLRHTGDSIKKVQHADFAIGLSQSTQQIKKRLMSLSIGKNRFGAANLDVLVKVDHEQVVFRDA